MHLVSAVAVDIGSHATGRIVAAELEISFAAVSGLVFTKFLDPLSSALAGMSPSTPTAQISIEVSLLAESLAH